MKTTGNQPSPIDLINERIKQAHGIALLLGEMDSAEGRAAWAIQALLDDALVAWDAHCDELQEQSKTEKVVPLEQ